MHPLLHRNQLTTQRMKATAEENEWILAYPNTDYDNYGDDLYYFYLDSKGRPFRADEQAEDDGKIAKGRGEAYRVDDDNPASDKGRCL